MKQESLEALIDIFNELCMRELQWSKGSWDVEKGEVRKDDLEFFKQQAESLLSIIEAEVTIRNEASKLSSVKNWDAHCERGFGNRFPQYLKGGRIPGFFHHRPGKSAPLTNDQLIDETELIKHRLEEFYQVEKEIMQSAGMNQAAVATVIDFLKRREQDIIVNILSRKKISNSKFDRSLRAGIDQARSIKSERHVPYGGYLKKSLFFTVKSKVVGFTTVACNVAPFLVGGDLALAGYLSTIGGATVGVILPSRSV